MGEPRSESAPASPSGSFLAAAAERASDLAVAANVGALLTDPKERQSALDIVGSLGLASAHLPELIGCLADTDEQVAFAAASMLCALDPHALAPHASQILRQFESVPAAARWRVVEALSALEPEALAMHADGVSRLAQASDADTRRRAVELMACLPELVLDVHAGAVLPLLADEDEDCRLSVVELFGRLPIASLERDVYVEPLLRTMRDDEEAMVRVGAVAVLAKVPVATLAAHTAAMMACLDDTSWRVRRQASEVLVTALPPHALAPHADAVLARLSHSDPRVREWAVATFARLASALEPAKAKEVGARAVGALKLVLGDEDRRVRERAAWLCGKLAEVASGATPTPATIE